MKSIIVAIAMFLSLVAAPARATNFNIFFFEGLAPGGPQIGSGTYSVADGKLTAFHALITGCINDVVVCNFNGTGGADPFDGIPSETFFFSDFPPINGQTESFLDLLESSGPFAHTFTTHTPGAFDPDGVYTVAATPEPSALWLILAGVASLVVRRLQQISKLVGGYMKTIIIAAILLLASQAYATSTNFFIFFDENNGEPFQHADWSGMYTITDGKLTAFSALIGTCADPLKCTWDHVDPPTAVDPGIPSSPGGIILLHDSNARLTYIPQLGNLWVTVNDNDSPFLRTGVYAVAATPEPPAILLVLAGLLPWLWMKFSKQ